MCGIYGYIGHPTEQNKNKLLELFTVLGVLTEPRGIDATGYYGLNTSVHTEKAPLKASDFFQTKEYLKIFEQPVMQILIGHNRWYTHGDPKINSNNHPFTTSRFGFIHNGIVGQVIVDVKQQTECDSEKIFRYFLKHIYNDHNHFTSLEKTMLAFKQGDFACALVDSKERSLFLFRNEDRPIAYHYLKNLNVIIFSSTKTIMKNAFKECNIKLNPKDILDLEPSQILKITETLNTQSHFVKGLSKPKPVYPSKYFSSSSLYSLPKPKKRYKVVGWECQLCKAPKKVFLNPSYTKQHIIDKHGVTDLNIIAQKIKHTVDRKAKVTFTQ